MKEMKSKESVQGSGLKNNIMKITSSFWKAQEQQLEVGVHCTLGYTPVYTVYVSYRGEL